MNHSHQIYEKYRKLKTILTYNRNDLNYIWEGLDQETKFPPKSNKNYRKTFGYSYERNTLTMCLHRKPLFCCCWFLQPSEMKQSRNNKKVLVGYKVKIQYKQFRVCAHLTV